MDVVWGLRDHSAKLCIGSSEKSTSFTRSKVIFTGVLKECAIRTIKGEQITYFGRPSAFHNKEGNLNEVHPRLPGQVCSPRDRRWL